MVGPVGPRCDARMEWPGFGGEGGRTICEVARAVMAQGASLNQVIREIPERGLTRDS